MTGASFIPMSADMVVGPTSAPSSTTPMLPARGRKRIVLEVLAGNMYVTQVCPFLYILQVGSSTVLIKVDCLQASKGL